MEDPELQDMHRLGEVLHKTLEEIRAMPVDDFESWRAWFRIKHKQQGGRRQKAVR